MRCNPLGIALIKRFESCRLTCYLDAVGIPTIGWGHTGPEVHSGLVWSQTQADGQFNIDLATKAEQPLNQMLPADLTSNQFSALCSLIYNIGSGAFASSTLLADIRAGRLGDVPAQFLRWDKANGQVLNGLLFRREAESALWSQA